MQAPYSKTGSSILLNLLCLSCMEAEVVKDLFLPLGNERLNYEVETDTALGVKKTKKTKYLQKKTNKVSNKIQVNTLTDDDILYTQKEIYFVLH